MDSRAISDLRGDAELKRTISLRRALIDSLPKCGDVEKRTMAIIEIKSMYGQELLSAYKDLMNRKEREKSK